LGVTLAHASQAFPEVEDLREPLLRRAQRLADLPGAGKRIRIHGDLHLGQTLRGAHGWFVYDFEGEPARSIDQRREKHSPLKDVAGMLRSFDYAGAMALLPDSDRQRVSRRMRDEFLRGYRQVTPADLLPPTEEAFNAFLEVLILEKALYEVRYELQMRPDWVKIPVAYVSELARAVP
jgi:trehalose synthase-fused probable maltokinase